MKQETSEMKFSVQRIRLLVYRFIPSGIWNAGWW